MRDLFNKMLDEGALTPAEAGAAWARLEQRMQRRSAQRWLLLGGALAATAAMALLVVRSQPRSGPDDVEHYVSRADGSPDDAIELILTEAR